MPEVEKTTPEPTPYGQVTTPRTLAQLRLRAEECVRSGDDGTLLDLAEELRQDRALWAHLWAPSAAVAAARAGRDEAWDLLDEAAAGGFCQPELFEGTLEELFGTHPGWEALRERMRSAPPPALELLDWPAPEPHQPLTYDAIPADREELLRDLLPPPEATSWATATAMLAWVHRRWEHANDHVEAPDAVEVLRRVDAGERFACVEYSIVLSQSLNARGIPARRVHLRQDDHHVGVGRGHVVSEAWIDDLAQWVLLDGQNGAYWADEDDRPLPLLELLDRYASGHPRPRMVRLVDGQRYEGADRWWTYFAGAKTTGFAWGTTYAPVFQNISVLTTERLLRDPRGAYPDLDEVAVGVGGSLEEPRLRLSTPHPYAEAFVVSGPGFEDRVPVDRDGWALRRTAGRRDQVRVAVLTPYGKGREHVVEYTAG